MFLGWTRSYSFKKVWSLEKYGVLWAGLIWHIMKSLKIFFSETVLTFKCFLGEPLFASFKKLWSLQNMFFCGQGLFLPLWHIINPLKVFFSITALLISCKFRMNVPLVNIYQNPSRNFDQLENMVIFGHTNSSQWSGTGLHGHLVYKWQLVLSDSLCRYCLNWISSDHVHVSIIKCNRLMGSNRIGWFY